MAVRGSPPECDLIPESVPAQGNKRIVLLFSYKNGKQQSQYESFDKGIFSCSNLQRERKARQTLCPHRTIPEIGHHK